VRRELTGVLQLGRGVIRGFYRKEEGGGGGNSGVGEGGYVPVKGTSSGKGRATAGGFCGPGFWGNKLKKGEAWDAPKGPLGRPNRRRGGLLAQIPPGRRKVTKHKGLIPKGVKHVSSGIPPETQLGIKRLRRSGEKGTRGGLKYL